MRIRRRLSPSLCVLWALVALPAAAQQPTPPVTRTAAELAGREADLLPDEPVVTQHTARIGGATVAYTAEAGWLPIRRDGKTVAKMFYVAYTRNGVQDLGRRPLLFSFNGGPGTASVWMHMGYTGPRRVVYDDEGFAPIPPGRLEDNPHSVLDVADIGPGEVVDVVNSWIDKPASTGYGNIFGTVTNAASSAPLSDLLVTAGGVQTLTDSAGRFLHTGLREGTHNVVAYALDGMYQNFQQGAAVQAGNNTPVDIRMQPSQLVNVIFTVSVPANTQSNVPIRLAGNLEQLGNTFADLRGGLSAVADRMPVRTTLPDGRYSVSLYLPAGADIQYKYTLGDGLWNAEHKSTGEYQLRQLIVPSQNAMTRLPTTGRPGARRSAGAEFQG